ncbi:hypothetical protein ElyMa_002254300 [Elysia marginata]|uniref:Uncharacterized protein n=1 Tax=Elysia marginata TaxID=1093978 RepID=A0AAV4G0W0_9GAST|nr:hypothetical protein ElyMa_002254300 [Elysia marginata]
MSQVLDDPAVPCTSVNVTAIVISVIAVLITAVSVTVNVLLLRRIRRDNKTTARDSRGETETANLAYAVESLDTLTRSPPEGYEEIGGMRNAVASCSNRISLATCEENEYAVANEVTLALDCVYVNDGATHAAVTNTSSVSGHQNKVASANNYTVPRDNLYVSPRPSLGSSGQSTGNAAVETEATTYDYPRKKKLKPVPQKRDRKGTRAAGIIRLLSRTGKKNANKEQTSSPSHQSRDRPVVLDSPSKQDQKPEIGSVKTQKTEPVEAKNNLSSNMGKSPLASQQSVDPKVVSGPSAEQNQNPEIKVVESPETEPAGVKKNPSLSASDYANLDKV